MIKLHKNLLLWLPYTGQSRNICLQAINCRRRHTKVGPFYLTEKNVKKRYVKCVILSVMCPPLWQVWGYMKKIVIYLRWMNCWSTDVEPSWALCARSHPQKIAGSLKATPAELHGSPEHSCFYYGYKNLAKTWQPFPKLI